MSGQPPTPGTPRHWKAWLDRYADDYPDDRSRRDGYRMFIANLAALTAIFAREDR